jgi:hypothetical protein
MSGNSSRRTGIAVAVFGIALLFAPVMALSHHHHGHCCNALAGKTSDARCDFCFQAIDPAQATTIQGKVETVEMGPGRGMPSISLVTDKGEKLNILVAPFWYLREHNFSVKPGDTLVIKAAKAKVGGNSHTVALELKPLSGTPLELRDDKGLPLWTRENCRGCCH